MLREASLSQMARRKIPKEQCIFVARRRGNDQLAPGHDLFNEFDGRKKQLEKKLGKGSREAHNQAFLDCGYEKRFREQILNDPKALGRLKTLCEQARERGLYFICYEGAEKACHRRILLRICEEQFEAEVVIEGVEPNKGGI